MTISNGTTNVEEILTTVFIARIKINFQIAFTEHWDITYIFVS